MCFQKKDLRAFALVEKDKTSIIPIKDIKNLSSNIHLLSREQVRNASLYNGFDISIFLDYDYDFKLPYEYSHLYDYKYKYWFRIISNEYTEILYYHLNYKAFINFVIACEQYILLGIINKEYQGSNKHWFYIYQ